MRVTAKATMAAFQCNQWRRFQAQTPCVKHAGSVRAAPVAGSRCTTHARLVVRSWKVWGPTAEYSDGDADFYRTTSRLADQYEWFAPGRQAEEQPQEEAETAGRERSEWGLTERQIAALGLSGPRTSVPDSVSEPPPLRAWFERRR